MEVFIVSGTQWGDEGKGKVAFYISQFTDVSIRCGGGSNAETTIYHKGKEWDIQMLPVGIIRGNIGLIADGLLINCKRLLYEIENLENKYGNVKDLLKISGNAHIVLPSHIEKDKYLDEKILKISTIKQGIGPALADRVLRTGISVDDYIDTYKKFNREIDDWQDREKYVRVLNKFRANTKECISKLSSTNKKILIQGSQGFMLDNVHGTYPYVTSSHTSTVGLLHGVGLPYTKVTRNIGVCKPYVTRYSTGPLPTECSVDEQNYIRDKGNEYSYSLRKPLRIGWLDLIALKYAQEINQYSELCLTKIDVLSGIINIPICIGYEYKGKVFNSCFDWNSQVSFDYKPIYKIFKGWSKNIRGIKTLSELPAEAKDYISFIEEFVKVKISMISTGPKDEEMIIT